MNFIHYAVPKFPTFIKHLSYPWIKTILLVQWEAIETKAHLIATFIMSIECCSHLICPLHLKILWMTHLAFRNTSGPVAAPCYLFINTDNYYTDEELRIVLEGQAQSLPLLDTGLAATALSIRQSWAAVRHRY